jgi:hypothetical protein
LVTGLLRIAARYRYGDVQFIDRLAALLKERADAARGQVEEYVVDGSASGVGHRLGRGQRKPDGGRDAVTADRRVQRGARRPERGSHTMPTPTAARPRGNWARRAGRWLPAEQWQEHLERGRTVGQCVVDCDQQGDAAAGQPVDEPDPPQWMVPVQARFQQPVDLVRCAPVRLEGPDETDRSEQEQQTGGEPAGRRRRLGRW